jgi:PIN domain nuclease of toxin-antitoxin system
MWMVWPQTRARGLSLADRACLSLGLRLNLPVLTCDRAWVGLALPLEIQLLR